MSQTDQNLIFIEIPMEALSPEAMRGLIESFVLREGTDYGAVEVSFESKCEQISRQLKNGSVKIVFDLENQTPTLMEKQTFEKLQIKGTAHSQA